MCQRTVFSHRRLKAVLSQVEIHLAHICLCGWQLLQNRSSHVQLWKAVWLAQALLFRNQTAVPWGLSFTGTALLIKWSLELQPPRSNFWVWDSQTGWKSGSGQKKTPNPGSCASTCSSPSTVTGSRTVACSFNIQALLLPKKPIATKSIVSKPN